jgi:hypothetical protein
LCIGKVAVHSDAIEVLVQLDCENTRVKTTPCSASASMFGVVGRR